MTGTGKCGGPSPSSACGAASAPGGLFGTSDLSEHRVLRRNARLLTSTAVLCAANGLMFLLGGPGVVKDVAIGLALAGVTLGYPLFIVAAKAVVRLRLTTEVFIALAVLIVLVIQHWWYASWVVTVMWLGETLMAWAGIRARSAIEALLKLVPKQARVVTDDGDNMMVPVQDVQVGQTVAIQPGEGVPVDGVVVRGESTVDQSMLTGESLPADVGVGDPVYAGTHNLVGALRVSTSTVAEENTVAQIVTMMRKAQTHQIPIPRAVDRFIQWFFPVALVGAIVVLILTGSFTRMASILLVLAPCAFSAATPLALVTTIGNAARYGIVIKNGSAIEALPRATTALLDKTGTLTTSAPVLDTVEAGGTDELEMLRLAASAESVIASHPLARAVLDAVGQRELKVSDPETAEVASGNGVLAVCDGRRVAVGNERFMQRIGCTISSGSALEEGARASKEKGRTIAYVSIDGEIRGFMGFLALPRPAAQAVVDGLRRFGFKHLVMLTGDQSRPAQAIADRLGLEVIAEATPQAKLDEVARRKIGGPVVMIGDGINDAGALAAADVGIAMGTTGAEVAASAADVVIHGDRFSRVLTAAKLARHGLRMIRLNIFFAFIFNLVGFALATPGLITPVTAMIIGMLSFLSVVVNSVLILSFRPRVVDDSGIPAQLASGEVNDKEGTLTVRR